MRKGQLWKELRSSGREGSSLVFEEEKGSSFSCSGENQSSREFKVGEQQDLVCVFKITKRQDN